MLLRPGVSGVGCLLIPAGRFAKVLLDASAKFVGESEHELGVDVSLRRTLQKMSDIRKMLGLRPAKREQRDQQHPQRGPLAHSSPRSVSVRLLCWQRFWNVFSYEWMNSTAGMKVWPNLR